MEEANQENDAAPQSVVNQSDAVTENDEPAAPNADEAHPAEVERPSNERRKNYSPKAVIRIFPPVFITMLLTCVSAKTWMWDELTDDDKPFSPSNLEGSSSSSSSDIPKKAGDPRDSDDDDDDDDLLNEIKWAIVVGLVIVAIVVTVTLIMVCLFKCRCDKCCNVFLGLTMVMVLGMTMTFLTPILVSYCGIPMDYPLFAFVAFNVVVVSGFCLMWKGPKCLVHAFQILIMVHVALMFGRTLPEWTTWVVVALLAIWDLIAVLPKRGPLRILVDTMEENNAEFHPALIYSSAVFYVRPTGRDAVSQKDAAHSAENGAGGTENAERSGFVSWGADETNANRCDTTTETESGAVAPRVQQTSIASSSFRDNFDENQNVRETTTAGEETTPNSENAAVLPIEAPADNQAAPAAGDVCAAPDSGEDDDGDGVKLGLGDFLFYSLVVVQASCYGSLYTLIATFFAILFGLLLTLLILILKRRALPALPISVALGIGVFFATEFLAKDFLEVYHDVQIQI